MRNSDQTAGGDMKKRKENIDSTVTEKNIESTVTEQNIESTAKAKNAGRSADSTAQEKPKKNIESTAKVKNTGQTADGTAQEKPKKNIESTVKAKNAGRAADGTAQEKPKKSLGRRILERVLGVVIILAVVLGVNYIASWCFEVVRLADYYNYDIKKLDKEDADVDMVILGASQVYHGCNPDVISSSMGIGEVIDCSTASLVTDSGYYMLKDMFRRFDPKYVLIELPWNKFLEKTDDKVKRAQLLAVDRLDLFGRLDFAFHCMEPDRWLDLLDMYRYGGSLYGGFGQLLKNYRAKKAVAEGNWIDESERAYRKNGYCWFNRSAPVGSIQGDPDVYSDDLIDEYEIKYLRKTQKLCEENGAQVIWFTMPTSVSELYAVENYQDSVDYMEAFAEETGYPYLNFNLLKDREKILPDTCYTDNLHLNGNGSIIFSEIFADTVQKALNGEDTGSVFYDDFAALQQDVDRIVFCTGTREEQDDGTILIKAQSWYSNEEIIPEYRLMLVEEEKQEKKTESEDSGEDKNSEGMDGEDDKNDTDDEEERIKNAKLLCDWQGGDTFVIQENDIPKGYLIRLEARQQGQTEPEAADPEVK